MFARSMDSEHATQSSAEQVVRSYIAALNAHDLPAMQALIAPECLRHVGWRDSAAPDPPGRGAAERSWRACPDWRYDLQTIVAAGDRVAVMVRASGHHTGEPLDIPGWDLFPPSGRLLRAAWSCTYRVSEGRIVELWQTSDLIVLLRDLGALPNP
jgi:predicted ester cyclase